MTIDEAVQWHKAHPILAEKSPEVRAIEQGFVAELNDLANAAAAERRDETGEKAA